MGVLMDGRLASWPCRTRRRERCGGGTCARRTAQCHTNVVSFPRTRRYNVDQVFDYLLSIGMSPVVELSFMPSHFVTCKNDACRYAFGDPGSYKGLVMPPDDFSDWYDLVRNLAQHLVDR
jgi:hypothetical protein